MDIILGISINEKIGDSIIVTIIATGFDDLSKSPKKASTQAASDIAEGITKESVVIDDDDNDIPAFFRIR